MDPLVDVAHVTFGYAQTPVLEDVSLHIHHGQFAALVGPSGAGKTSLLKLVLGLLKPNHGTVRLHGQAIGNHTPPRVGYVPQLETVDWNFPVTAEQVVLMGRHRRSSVWPWPSAEDKRRVGTVLEQLGIAELAGNHIRNLSGGQQQRVFLARALIAEPDLLVLDEPTTGVDVRTAEQVLGVLTSLNQQGLTILMTTHDLNAAAAHVPWVVCLNRRVVAQGPPARIFTPSILNTTYDADMIVLQQDGMLFVHQKPQRQATLDAVPQSLAPTLPV